MKTISPTKHEAIVKTEAVSLKAICTELKLDLDSRIADIPSLAERHKVSEKTVRSTLSLAS